MHEPSLAETTASVVLERHQPLSQSMLWQHMQRQFFEREGIEAWSRGIVPHYVTSNPRIANAYAQLAFAYLRDCAAGAADGPDGAFPPLDRSEPIYIIELGAGSGRFAYHFLKQFMGFFPESTLRDLQVRYVMTDFAAPLADYWRRHPSLKPFMDSGLLDLALFDATQPGDLDLMVSGSHLAAGSVKNPIIVIANYVFDSIPQDSFSIHEGRLYENLITLASPQPEPGPADLLAQLEVSYDSRLAAAEYYDDSDFNQILAAYQDRLGNTTLTFPVAGLGCIRYFNQLARGRLMVLSADKGYDCEEALLGLNDPVLSLHGSFSMMVNHHAIAHYTQLLGGKTLQPAQSHASLCVAAFLFGQPPASYRETRQAFGEWIAKGGPDDFFMLKKAAENHIGDFSLHQLLAYFRLSCWDASIFLASAPALHKHLDSASPRLRRELYRAILQVWDMYYPIGEDDDVPFQMAMLLQAMALYPEALEFYDPSLRLSGPDPSTFYNSGMCHYNLRQLQAAAAAIQRAIELEPEFEAAKAVQIQLQAEIGFRIS
jgi:tetratricopeptide (TPR) repeat protein